MIASVTLLLVCQLIGEVVVRGLGLPLPGPVLGMALLFAGLLLRGGVPEPLQTTSRALLDNLSLLFVPAGVGVMLYLPLVAEEWLPLGAALLGSTLLTVAVTALLLSRLLGPATKEERQE